MPNGDAQLVNLITVALGSGLTVKVLDIIYQEWRQTTTRRITAKEVVDRHLDPLLKSADEFVGKVWSLSEGGFQSIRGVDPEAPSITNHDFGSLLFLTARFWAQVEAIRYEGMSVAMAKDERGSKVQKFFDCLESRNVRLLERVLQRAVGEVSFREGMSAYSGFVAAYETDDRTRKWLLPLARFLTKLNNTSQRQTLLQYGAIVHAFIDTMDPRHLVTRNRPSWPGRLTKRSITNLRFRVFGVYLKFVQNQPKYVGRRTPKSEGAAPSGATPSG